MVYQVDTARIQSQLAYLDRCCRVLDEVGNATDDASFFAASRALHIGVECVIDVGSVMIDGFIMRDPGGYEDIIDIMEDERVIPQEGVRRLKRLVALRDRLARHYTGVEQQEVVTAIREGREMFPTFISWVNRYLKQELGAQWDGGDRR
ncbi:DUF86 domain-containing protein [Desmospora profundinema]|uniref:Uncharacterized protein YutE (UPF0331/DUF86 family) n=1 Tax=Desmospora profundinema TaxID=1571184 RepID=A0ABU1INC7_9BACL|nr:DUF86 domain-containing protein [Desmospora profundinema]MDR6226238.1 uncharacterized protein YutE (UPF0331/DUF86 family) [Desmospora profundinema]